MFIFLYFILLAIKNQLGVFDRTKVQGESINLDPDPRDINNKR